MVGTGVAVRVGIVVVTVGGLWLGARLLVDSVVRLARRFGLSELTIGLTVVAAGTSAPELIVTTDAALAGLGGIAVGNVIGSNIYNLAGILGIISLIRIIPIERSLVRRDGVALLASTLLAASVLVDDAVTRLEGAAFVGIYLGYAAYLLRSDAGTGSDEPVDAGPDDASAVRTPLIDRVSFPGRNLVFLAAGLAITLVSGDLLVEAASSLARGAGVSELVIGGTIVAAGTSTPEFAVSLVALRSGRLGVSVGNVVGSNVFNVLLILGLGAVLRPLTVAGGAVGTVVWLTVLTVGMVAALWTGRKLSRPEGGLLVVSEALRWTLGLLGYLR